MWIRCKDLCLVFFSGNDISINVRKLMNSALSGIIQNHAHTFLQHFHCLKQSWTHAHTFCLTDCIYLYVFDICIHVLIVMMTLVSKLQPQTHTQPHTHTTSHTHTHTAHYTSKELASSATRPWRRVTLSNCSSDIKGEGQRTKGVEDFQQCDCNLFQSLFGRF